MTVKESVPIEKRIESLEKITLLNSLNYQELKTLAGYLDAYRVTGGTTIIREGTQKSFLAFIIEGGVVIKKRDEQGHDREMAAFSQGKMFGEMSLLDGEPSSASVIARQETLFLVLMEKKFQGLIKDYPRVAVKLLLVLGKMLSSRLRLTSGRLVDYLNH